MELVSQGPGGVLLILVSVRQHSLCLNFFCHFSLVELLVVLAFRGGLRRSEEGLKRGQPLGSI